MIRVSITLLTRITGCRLEMGTGFFGNLYWCPHTCILHGWCVHVCVKQTEPGRPDFYRFIVPETYAPALLRQRAARLSKVTGKYYRAPMDAEKELDIRRVFLTQLSMPWKLLFQEPIVMAISIYMAIVYVRSWHSSINLHLSSDFLFAL